MTIYLDHAATAPINEVAIDAITKAMRNLGNASSVHNHGRAIRKDVEDARHALSELLVHQLVKLFLLARVLRQITWQLKASIGRRLPLIQSEK